MQFQSLSRNGRIGSSESLARNGHALRTAHVSFTNRVQSKQYRHLARAEGDNNKNGEKLETKQEKLVKDLKRGGVDQETAQRILTAWEETGAKSAEGLRKLLVGRSLRTAGIIGLQTLLDAGASYGALTSGASVAAGGDFFGKIAVEFILYFLGIYFGTSVLLDLFTLGAVAYSGYNFSADSEAFLNAVREVAGPKSSINVLQKAKDAVNIGKVVSALNKIQGILKEKAADGSAENSLDNLSVYLTLSKAEAAGFKAESYGLTGEQAGRIASIFSKYDTNDDFVLSTTEISQLFREEGYNFNDQEVREAIKLLDKNNDKYIQFSEFVDWWQNSIPEDKKQELEQTYNKSESKEKETANSK